MRRVCDFRVLLRPLLFAALPGLLLTGCITQQAPMPDLPKVSVAQLPHDAPIVGLTPTQDERAEQRAGTIGALRIEIGGDLVAYVDAALRQGLIERGFRVVGAPDPRQLEVELEYVFNAKVIAVDVEEARIGSADALLDPADASVTLTARVFDEQGKNTYSTTQVGRNSGRVGFSGGGGAEGRIIAGAADRAVAELLDDPGFVDAIR